MACTVCGESQQGRASSGLAPCLSCLRPTHERCDSAYVQKLNNGKGPSPAYACPGCRSAVEAMGIQALARVNRIEEQLQQGLKAAVPRSSLDIFVAEQRKLRLSKEGGALPAEDSATDPIIMLKWERLRSKERQEYDSKAHNEAAAFQSHASQLVSAHKEYAQLCACLGRVPDKALSPSAALCIAAGVPSSLSAQTPSELQVQSFQQQLQKQQQEEADLAGSKRADADGADASDRQDKRRRKGGVAGLSSSMDGAVLLAEASSRLATEQQGSSKCSSEQGGASGSKQAFSTGGVADAADDDEETTEADREADGEPAAPPAPVATNQFGILPANSMQDLPEQIPVSCSGVMGTFVLQGIKVICGCRACSSQPPQHREFHPTHWESHCGAGAAKKWKASIKIEAGGIPELASYMSNMPIGRYFDMKGVELRPARTLGGPPVLEFLGSSLNREKMSGLSGLGSPRGASLIGVKRTIKAPSLGMYAKPYNGSINYTGDFKPCLPWAPWDDVKNGNYIPIKVRWAGDRCCVCDSDVDYDIDQLVSCDGCGITCHQSCYGIPEVPGPDDIWLCRTCELKEKGEDAVKQCCLCPIEGGALKPTTLDGGQWCHAACMQWIPEVTCQDPMRMEPIDHIQAIQKERWELQCTVCKQRMGAKIQCSSCYTAYHPLCARMAGLHMEMVEPPPGNADMALQVISYCPKHCRPQPHLSGVQPVRHTGGGAFGDGSGLWNAQPFPIPPAVSTPQCQAGCARAQALVNWERERHGTGAGCTTMSGYWMPGPDAPLAPGGGPLAGGGGFGLWGDGWIRPRSVGRPRGSRGRGTVGRPRIHPIEGMGRPLVGVAANMPPPKVALLPLPGDTPESIPIVCAGRYGELMLRTQRVVHEGVSMTASRFEQLCGRGDAKKWKNSFWLVNAAGQPESMLQDWLGVRGLDRARLAALANNAMQVEAHDEWVENKDKEGTPGAGEGGMDGASEQQALQVLEALKGAQQQQSREDALATAMAAQMQGTAMLLHVPRKRGRPPKNAAALAARQAEHAQALAQAKAEHAAMLAQAASASASPAPPPAPQPAFAAHNTTGSAPSPAPASVGSDSGAPVGEAPPAAQNGSASVQQDTQAAALNESDAADGVVQGDAAPAEGEAADGPPAKFQLARPVGPTLDELRGSAVAAAAAPCLAPGAAAREPEECVGQCCRMYWEDDSAWYAADVVAYDDVRGQHKLWYHIDENEEWIDLKAEEASGNVQWLPLCDSSLWPPAPPVRPKKGEAPQPDAPQPPLPAAPIQPQQQQPQAVEGSSRSPPPPPPAPAGKKGKGNSAASVSIRDDSPGVQPPSASAPPPSLATRATRITRHLSAAPPMPPSAPAPPHPSPPLPMLLSSEPHRTSQPHPAPPSSMLPPSAPLPSSPAPPPFLPAHPSHSQQPQQSTPHILLMPMRPPPAPVPPPPLPPAAPQLPVPCALQRTLSHSMAELSSLLAAAPLDHTRPGSMSAAAPLQAPVPPWPSPPALQPSLLTHHSPPLCSAEPSSLPSLPMALPLLPPSRHCSPGVAQPFVHRHAHSSSHQTTLPSQACQAPHTAAPLLPLLDPLPPPPSPPLPPPPAPPPPKGGVHKKTGGHSAAKRQRQEQQQQQQQQAAAMEEDGPQAAPMAPTSDPSSAPPSPPPKKEVPPYVNVVCNGLTGKFLSDRMEIQLPDGRSVSGTEFERMAGRGAAKKWKVSIRIQKSSSNTGTTLQDWMVEHGLEAPRTRTHHVAKSSDTGGFSAELGRRRAAQRRAVREVSSSDTLHDSDDFMDIDLEEERPRPPPARGPNGELPKRGPGRPPRPHRYGCMCVICKQCRAAGTLPPLEPAALAAAAAEQGGDGCGVSRLPQFLPLAGLIQPPGRGGPGPRFGKRAYIRAVPHVVAGLRHHKLWEIPPGKVWDPAEFEAVQEAAAAEEAAAQQAAIKAEAIKAETALAALKAMGESPAAVAPPADPQQATLRAEADGQPEAQLPPSQQQQQHTKQEHGLEGAAGDPAPSLPPPQHLPDQPQQPVIKSEPGLESDEAAGPFSSDAPDAPDTGVKSEAAAAAAASHQAQIKRERTQQGRVQEKLRQSRATEQSRLSFGKSGIHGWGIFALRSIPQDSLVAEYRGEIVRNSMADHRETRYREGGQDCYLFRVNDDVVVDSTNCGGISRFCNHCCMPSLYTRVINDANGSPHVAFYAKSDLKAGQELTFDYRFKEEAGDKVRCDCGAPNCKGSLN